MNNQVLENEFLDLLREARMNIQIAENQEKYAESNYVDAAIARTNAARDYYNALLKQYRIHNL